ncbi:MAG: sigma-70 family RNA polymerase sigma factor, partial [Phycisphaerales bacterium]|nr:sigma-70 family RNA polymerase sigma factor [Phycisphaerales bacterium]
MEVTTTTTLLLDGLRDESNEAAWCDFDRRYRPIIIAFARRLGLNEEDAADVAQSTLIRFVKSYRAGQYDRTRGRLRSWIIGIVACRIADLQKSRGARREHRGDSAIIVMPADDRISEMWDEEHRREVLRQAFRELREQTRTSDATLAAFELFVI